MGRVENRTTKGERGVAVIVVNEDNKARLNIKNWYFFCKA